MIDKEELKRLGYTVHADKYGYKVECNGRFVAGAGVAEKRKMHWQHARKNVLQNGQDAWTLAYRDYVKNKAG